MPHLIESLAITLAELEPAAGEGRAAYTVSPERLHLARGPAGTLELFIEGPLESFGDTAFGKYLDFGRFSDTNSGRDFEAIVVRTDSDATALRLMAHLAYEADKLVSTNVRIDNRNLLVALAPFLALVAERALLDVDQQKGLTAELMLLLELIGYCQGGGGSFDPGLAIEAWRGWEGASRDFANGNVAVEVKATARSSRKHEISSLHQLTPDGDKSEERVYIYSVGLWPDSSRAFKLLTQIERIEKVLSSDLNSKFHDRLRGYDGRGFHPEFRSHYRLATGFVVRHPPTLYRIDNIEGVLRPESFVGGGPPERVEQVRYVLSLDGLVEVPEAERAWLFGQLLNVEPTS